MIFRCFTTNQGNDVIVQQQRKHGPNRETYIMKVVGDCVLVKMVSFDRKHTLDDKKEQDPYKVIAQPNEDIPVFTIRKENGEGCIRTLHRNLLLPISFLNDSPLTPAPRKTRTKSVTKRVCEEPRNTQHGESRESASKDDSVWGIVVSHEEQETSSPVTADETFIAQETNGENQDSIARNRE